MATIKIKIPDDAYQRVLDGFAYHFKHQPMVLDPETQQPVENPVNKAQLVNMKIREFVTEVTKTAEADVAAERTRAAKMQEAFPEITEG